MRTTRFLAFLIPAIVLFSCSGTVETQSGGEGGGCGGLNACPAATKDFCLPGDVPVAACCFATSDGRHLPIGLCPPPDAGTDGCPFGEPCGDGGVCSTDGVCAPPH